MAIRWSYQRFSDKKDIIIVGDIWELAEGDDDDGKPADRLLSDHPKLKELCLPFMLFKLLCARFENRQVDDEVPRKNRNLIFRGLGGHSSDKDDTTIVARVFHMIELELNFVSNYYHSVLPWCSID